MTEAVADIGLIGLAVMGQNLVLNMNDHGYVVCAFNRTTSKVTEFLENEAKGTKIVGAYSIEELCAKLKKPRRVMMLVRAGSAVDDFIELVIPHLEKGDIIIDGGNSHFPDTLRRVKYLREKGIHFIGAGVSGGEEGARYGPSIMPGGAVEAWPAVKPIFQAISAKADNDPCCDWIGPDASGHYVKMVHNGIEYGDMQLICEAYHLMKAVGMSCDEMSEAFRQWNKEELDSFLMEISTNILAFKDTDGEPLVEKIRDCAGQKGTGKWTGIEALDLGIPLTLIGEAVFARCLSAIQSERVVASKVLSGPSPKKMEGAERDTFVKKIKFALYASKIVSYAQGFMLLRQAAQEHKWGELNWGGIALMWRGGCIIRSRFLADIKTAFEKNPSLTNLLLDDFFVAEMARCQVSWRDVVSTGAQLGIPLPTFSSALAFYDGYRSERLPANLLQAQRDYFGCHTYERLDKPGTFEHTNWTGTGGRVTSNTYVV
jgi:6-phosphogluconate dehydrogenase